MSDAYSGRNFAGGGDGAAAPPQQYFCYRCKRTVSIRPSPSSTIQCLNCGGGFLEKYENPTPIRTLNRNPFLAFSDGDPSDFPSLSQGFRGFPLVFSSTSRVNVAGGGNGGVAADPPQQYFCYRCERTVSLSRSPSNTLRCLNCGGGFLEICENPNPTPILNPNRFLALSDDDPSDFPSLSQGSGGFPLVFSSTSHINVGGGSGGGRDVQNPFDRSAALLGSPLISQSGSNQYPGEFNPITFPQNYINTVQAGGMIENNSDNDPSGVSRLSSNLGDYFFGPGLEQSVQQLYANDPNRYGTPPASKSAVQALPNIMITKELLDSAYSDCAVCKDGFELDEEAKQMPCKHIYHNDCLIPWLELHNSCPVCWYELPTDDPDYENRSRDGAVDGGTAGSVRQAIYGGTSQENPLTPWNMERRFRISKPWLFGGLGSPAETSSGGAENNNDGDTNPGRGQAREEDLD